ncbi:hypothetical protein A2697_01630 [Candidatus Curtissbacteria bacterium RIFCSPHIGHO2_01_FULL_41_44]|uniref:Methyltransferase type 11 domain-containing protein n=1 Tax=Candidatus Curtissbacteria bacterium RIFCSPLOWO2_01_FULL_42_50 TaxID=1797730 RepID=A0A1F5H6A6_9BACT|nr:MAG: hypothetical protein A2697_01630 [Candidatus Curtissbacteria bacterium RIFCSPHIGHO2_01_FULL_41_44]OGD99631.1 MAG: hypothetical protein A3B54_03005 [Candidatus Curtissbacteria bacterium RIFCSPLOWO2_01_FULL_42_50]
MNNIPYSPSRLDSTKYFLKNLPKYVVGSKNLLDVGCGKLYFFDMLEELNFKGTYLGIDIDPKKLTYFKIAKNTDVSPWMRRYNPREASTKRKKNHGRQPVEVYYPKGIEFKIQKKSILDFKGEKKFDMAICLWVLEHIKSDSLAIDKINAILKPKGILVIAVPSIWSWPFEFGRHGFHYYSKSRIQKMLAESGFEILEQHSSGGAAGFLFMIAASWPRLLSLIPLLIIYALANKLSLNNKRSFSSNKNWKDFSTNFVRNTFYKYHNYKIGINIHNFIVDKITVVDNLFKILPASHILILRKK